MHEQVSLYTMSVRMDVKQRHKQRVLTDCAASLTRSQLHTPTYRKNIQPEKKKNVNIAGSFRSTQI